MDRTKSSRSHWGLNKTRGDRQSWSQLLRVRYQGKLYGAIVKEWEDKGDSVLGKTGEGVGLTTTV